MPPKTTTPKKKRMACPICGATLAGKVSSCPNCFIRFDDKMHPICPICGIALPPGQTKCEKCGTDLKTVFEKKETKDFKQVLDSVIDELIGETAKEVKAEDKRFSCPKCDALLGGDEKRCPKCNTPLVGETAYQCPVCGTAVSSSMKSCPHCGVSFIEAEEKAPSAPPKVEPPQEGEVVTCPRCGTVVTMTNSHCPQCGAEFEAEEVTEEAPPAAATPEEEEILCANCHRPVGAAVSKCPYCGAEFEEGVEEAPEIPPERPSKAPAAAVPEEEVTVCQFCGKPVSAGAASCPHCGAVFEAGEEEIPASLSFPKKALKVPEKAAEIAAPARIEKAFLRLARPVDLKVIVGFAAFGVVLLFLAYSVQVDLNALGAPLTPDAEHQFAALEGKRNVYLLTASGCLFLALFGASLPSERVTPIHVLQNQMLSTARTTGDYCRSNSLGGNALYLPAKNGLTRERVFIPVSAGLEPPKKGLTDAVTALATKSGGVGAVLLEPLGLSLLDHVEGQLNIKMSGAGLESVENTLQTLKHDYGLMKDFHFKERDGKTVLRVEYGGLANACNSVRKERPETCRQNSCFGCACMLSAAARATGKMVKVESVDNGQDRVEFTISLQDW